MTDLPPGWAATTLGEVTEIVGGSTPKTTVDEFWGGEIPWITPDDLSRHKSKTIAAGRRFLTQQGSDSTSTRLVPTGSVLFTSRAPIGYVAIASRPVCTNQGFKSVVPPDGIASDYLYWYLRHFTPMIQDMGSGTTFKEVSKKRMAEVSILLPPLAEQERIVAAIEDHFSHLDAAGSSLHRAQRNLDRLRRAHVDDLLGSLDCEWTTLGDIAEIKGGVTKDSKKQDDPDMVEVPYLRVANVQRGHLVLDEVTRIKVPPKKAKDLELLPNDILFNEGGDRDKLGRGWIWEGQVPGCIHQNHVFRARLKVDDVDPRFISTHGNTWGQRWFEKNGKQTTNLASINLTTLKSFPVPSPRPRGPGRADGATGRRPRSRRTPRGGPRRRPPESRTAPESGPRRRLLRPARATGPSR